MLTAIVSQSANITEGATRPPRDARFPSEVVPVIDILTSDIDNHLGRTLAWPDRVYVNRRPDGRTTYSTRAAMPDFERLHASTDWHHADGSASGHFLGTYGAEAHPDEARTRLVLLSAVRCTVYSWCSGHDALDLSLESSTGYHGVDDRDLADFASLEAEVGGNTLKAVGSKIDDEGRDRYNVLLEIDLTVGKAGLRNLVAELRSIATNLDAEADGMTDDEL
ncbi:hypothetical protein [Rathayibacter sp. AY1B8]|uniref:hypothetical protein n=1 Tax=Rathayibacter sp. AY1B8 TaxID=2080533 RepID=UPI000CE7A285|nr:hypothetical protein [Rathayibacter sp. AY1B8]PPI08216.1 hypothetical protein C5C63_04485 [Rathayibacter sp. AY1B8]